MVSFMRRHRVDVPGGIHHVMNRGIDRGDIFFGDVDRVEFGSRLAAIHEEFGVQTLAYCLLDNHYHLLLRTPEAGISAAMQHLASVYARHTNDRLGRDGPLFRGRFHAIHVTTDRYLAAAARYIHRNAIDVVGAERIREYRWSSYRTYLGCRRTPPFLDTELVMSLYGGDLDAFIRATESDLEPTIATPDDQPIDIEPFLRFERARLELESADDAPEPASDRMVLLLLADATDDITLAADVDRRLGFPSAGTRRTALSRARRRLADDPSLALLVDRLLTRLTVTSGV